MEQIPLFEDKYMLINDAAAALKALRLDNALESLKRYRDLYRDGEDVERKFKIASFLREGLSAAPPSGPDRPPYLFQLWRSFGAFCRSLGPGSPTDDELRRPFFHKIVAAIGESRLADSAFLADGIPVGYAHLQTGEYDRAIRSLQACLIATPDNAVIYGYLGDAYLMRGDREVARQIYFTACLIDPVVLDWNHLRDDQLKDLLEQLPEEYDCDPSLACEWLPAYAYVQGLFRPKQIRLWEEFKTFTDGYFELKKTALKTPSPSHAARLFLRGIVLCDNEPFLRMFKGIEFAEVRREMKEANAALFAEYLKQIDRRRQNGVR
jgi:tetratricopeptide (TPR) repeat protein